MKQIVPLLLNHDHTKVIGRVEFDDTQLTPEMIESCAVAFAFVREPSKGMRARIVEMSVVRDAAHWRKPA